MDYPNILYLHSHDTGRYIQPYGYPVATPHLQQLAEEGVLFRQAFCAAPMCSASRASLLTGMYPHNNGMLGLAHRGFSLYDYHQHIVHTLRKLGYYSVLIGEQHIAKEPAIIGYDRVIKTETHLADVVAPLACQTLRDMSSKPFFLSVGFFEAHREFHTPASEKEARYCTPPPHLPDTPETRRDMAGFQASVRALDQGIGEVLNALDACGLAENTLVICTTDHGIAFPGAKATLTDRGTGVLLIMRGPGGFWGGHVLDAMVSHIDIFPTICDLLQIAPPSWLQGRSLVPLLQEAGRKSDIHDAVFTEGTYHAAYEPQRAVRTKRWKYIRRFAEYDGPILPNCDDGDSKAILVEHGWREHAIAHEQLYDLIFDPNEAHNVAADPADANVLEEMRRRLKDWMKTTSDPLYSGGVLAPLGAELNDLNQLSPSEPTRIISQGEKIA